MAGRGLKAIAVKLINRAPVTQSMTPWQPRYKKNAYYLLTDKILHAIVQTDTIAILLEPIRLKKCNLDF